MIGIVVRASLALAAVLVAHPASALDVLAAAGLDRGPHSVGFRVMAVLDPSRPAGPREAADRSRRLSVHVWFPAGSDTGGAMTMNDYLETVPGVASEHRQLLARAIGVQFSDEQWAQYRALEFGARRDAAPAPGRFPLLIGILRPVSVVTMAEYLASHGYVVAFVQGPRDAIAADGLALEALTMAEQMRDMQVAVAALRAEPFVRAAGLGALGFSGDGLAQLVLAMRFAEIDAVSQLETGYFGPTGTSSYEKMTAYDPSVLRAPFLFAYSENLGRNTDLQIAEIDRMRYAPRYLLYLGEPRLNHWDFATEGVALAAAMNARPDARAGVARAFVAVQRYQRLFFDAFVKGDATARDRLAAPPAPAAGGALIEASSRPAIVPAITRREFQRQFDADPDAALRTAREGFARDPLGALFDAEWLNGLGYELLQRNRKAHAIAVFQLNADAHPASANAFDSLSEALESAGRAADALAAAEKGMALLQADTTVPEAQKRTMAGGLRARIDRLRR